MDQDNTAEIKTSPSELAEQIVARLNGLDNLAKVAISNEAGQLEMRRQIGELAAALQKLAGLSQEQDFGSAMKWLVEDLQKLAENAELTPSFGAFSESLRPEVTTEEQPGKDDPNQGEPKTRVALSIPSYLAHSQTKILPEQADEKPVDRLKVIVGSLERTDQTINLLRQAQSGFDLQAWEVFDMGSNVPIMALTGAVMEKRPNVVVLVMATAQLVSEMARLVTDLRKKLPGLKVIVVGPPVTRYYNLSSRLEADGYGPDPLASAELAELALNSIGGMQSQLRLDMDELESELPSVPTLEETLPAEEPEEKQESSEEAAPPPEPSENSV